MAKAQHAGTRARRRRTDSGERLVDGITRELRDLILDNKIKPGTVLLQAEWSERLKVSRTPLREAFRILEQSGLVQASNGNRTLSVVRYTAKQLEDLYEVRGVIDGLAARLLAAKSMSDPLRAELGHLLDVMDVGNRFDATVWFPAHTAFHVRIAEECGNSRVQQELNLIRSTSASLHTHLAELQVDGPELSKILAVADRQHRSTYEAILSRNGDLAEATACHHITTTLRSGLIPEATDGE